MTNTATATRIPELLNCCKPCAPTQRRTGAKFLEHGGQGRFTCFFCGTPDVFEHEVVHFHPAIHTDRTA